MGTVRGRERRTIAKVASPHDLALAQITVAEQSERLNFCAARVVGARSSRLSAAPGLSETSAHHVDAARSGQGCHGARGCKRNNRGSLELILRQSGT